MYRNAAFALLTLFIASGSAHALDSPEAVARRVETRGGGGVGFQLTHGPTSSRYKHVFRSGCRDGKLFGHGRIMGIPRGVSWEAVCAAMDYHRFGQPVSHQCENRGINGMWAVVILDEPCRAMPSPKWGTLDKGAIRPPAPGAPDELYDQGCRGGKRTYAARLWNIPSGKSWEEACQETSASVNGKRYGTPDTCVNRGAFGIVGKWSVADPSCSVEVKRLEGAITWTIAEASCPRKKLCKIEDVCDGTRFLGTVPNGDVWMAVADHKNAWIAIGQSYPERRCQLHETLGGPPS